MAALTGPGKQPSFGQTVDMGRKKACGCYICGDPRFRNFEDPPTNCAGILSVDACPTELAKLPEPTRKNFCQKVKEARNITSFKDSCPEYAAACEPEQKDPPPGKKCPKPSSWFGNSSNCSDVQSPIIAITQPLAPLLLRRPVTLSICGHTVFRHVDNFDSNVETYKHTLTLWVQERVGSKICCDKFREAARTGTPCDPRADVDCDGEPNETDILTEEERGGAYGVMPDINLFSTPEGAPVAPFPFGLDPDDPSFLPPAEKCDCKWELMKGTLKCSSDGRQRHSYEARWKCPSTGNEMFTRKEAPPTARCP